MQLNHTSCMKTKSLTHVEDQFNLYLKTNNKKQPRTSLFFQLLSCQLLLMVGYCQKNICLKVDIKP